MDRRIVFAALIPALAALTGCAALFASKSTDVAMNSNPVGAEVYLDGNRLGTTPLNVDLSNNRSYELAFRVEGRPEVTCVVNREIGVGWVVLDVLGGLIPVIIDAATGSWYNLDRNSCNVTLVSGPTFEEYVGGDLLARSDQSAADSWSMTRPFWR